MGGRAHPTKFAYNTINISAQHVKELNGGEKNNAQ